MSKVESGAKLELRINNIPVAYASNVSYSYQHNHEEVRSIDNPEVIEHAELHTSVSFTCSAFRVARKTAISYGWMPKLQNFLQQPTLTAIIYSKVSRTKLLTITGLKCTGRSGSVNARGVWEEQLTFVGRQFFDENS
jgi:hypothetical protein